MGYLVDLEPELAAGGDGVLPVVGRELRPRAQAVGDEAGRVARRKAARLEASYYLSAKDQEGGGGGGGGGGAEQKEERKLKS